MASAAGGKQANGLERQGRVTPAPSPRTGPASSLSPPGAAATTTTTTIAATTNNSNNAASSSSSAPPSSNPQQPPPTTDPLQLAERDPLIKLQLHLESTGRIFGDVLRASVEGRKLERDTLA